MHKRKKFISESVEHSANKEHPVRDDTVLLSNILICHHAKMRGNS